MCIRDRFEPVKNRGGVRFDVTVRAMSPKSFTGHNILQAIAIHVDQLDRMELGKTNAIGIGDRPFVEDQMLAESDLTAFFDLFIPSQPITMRLSLIHISEPTRLLSISYAVFCL